MKELNLKFKNKQVKIFDDPFTEKKLEGIAEIKEVLNYHCGIMRCLVKFNGIGEPLVEREVREKNIIY